MSLKSSVKQAMRKSVLIRVVYRLERMSCRNGSGEAEPENPAGVIALLRPRPTMWYREARFLHEAELELSVILPVYNVAEYLPSCLDALLFSVSERTYEVIAVDDGSADDSSQILDRYAKDYKNLVVVRQENAGLSAARNEGLERSRGRYVAFVDSDDVMSVDDIWDLVDAAEHGGTGFTSGEYERIDGQGNKLGDRSPVSSLMVPWGRAYRREVWGDIRFPEGCWYEDVITPYLVESRYRGADVVGPLYKYRVRQGSIVESTHDDPRGLDSFWLIEVMLSECRRLEIPFDEYLYGQTLRLMGPLLLGRSWALDEGQRRCLFFSCCDLLEGTAEFGGMRLSEPTEYWEDLESALRTRNYRLWCLACCGLTLMEGGPYLRAVIPHYLSVRRQK